MKAVRFSQFGGPEVLEIVDLPPGERPRLDAFRPAAGVNGFPKRESNAASQPTSGFEPLTRCLQIRI